MHPDLKSGTRDIDLAEVHRIVRRRGFVRGNHGIDQPASITESAELHHHTRAQILRLSGEAVAGSEAIRGQREQSSHARLLAINAERERLDCDALVESVIDVTSLVHDAHAAATDLAHWSGRSVIF